MAPVPFYPEANFYKRYYGDQKGGSLGNVFAGSKFQKGYGLGGLLAGLFKTIIPAIGKHLLPIFKSGAKSIGQQALKTGSAVIQDAIEGKNIKSSLRQRATEGVNTLVGSAIKKVSAATLKRPSTSHQRKKAKRKKRRTAYRKHDIFDE